MTTVTIYKYSNGAYQKFICIGHAEFAKKSLFRKNIPDILCAGISALIINTINALEQLGNESLDLDSNEDTGFIKCEFLKPLQEKSEFLMDAMILGLENLSKEYGGDYLQVKYEEV